MTKNNKRNQQQRAQQESGGDQADGQQPAAAAASPAAAAPANPSPTPATPQKQPPQSKAEANQQQAAAAFSSSSAAASAAPPSTHLTAMLTLTKANGAAIRAMSTADPCSASSASSSSGIAPISGDFGGCAAVTSRCGQYVAFASQDEVFILKYAATTGAAAAAAAASALSVTLVLKQEFARCIHLDFSPKSTFLVCYAQHDARRNADSNLLVLRISDGCAVASVGQALWPALMWSADEAFAVRRARRAIVVVRGDLSDIKTNSGAAASNVSMTSSLELNEPQVVGKEAAFCVNSYSSSADSAAPPLLAVFTPQVKNDVAAVRIFRLPDLASPVMTRLLGRGDRAVLSFSGAGFSLAAKIVCDDDRAVRTATGSPGSYYGSSHLHLIDVRSRGGELFTMSVSGEAVHDVAWNPAAGSEEFIVVHGVMPRNKATLARMRGTAVSSSSSSSAASSIYEPLFFFAEAPRNVCKWAPSGKIFALGGCGSLPGDWTFHCRDDVVTSSAASAAQQQVAAAAAVAIPPDGKVGSLSEKTTHQAWLPDSRHFVVSNLFRTLKVDNKIKIFKYNGEKVFEEKVVMAGGAGGDDVLHDVAFFSPTQPTAGDSNNSVLAATMKQQFWSRRYVSPVKNTAKVAEPVGAWKPRHQSAAAAALLALPSGGVGNSAVASLGRPPGSAPVGAVLAKPSKKKGGR